MNNKTQWKKLIMIKPTILASVMLASLLAVGQQGWAAEECLPDSSCSEAESRARGQVRLVVRADDMGLFESINEACIQAYTNGIVRSVEVLVSAPWFLHAARLLAQHPGLDVGIHLNLTCGCSFYGWRPLTHAPGITDPDGFFYRADVQGSNSPPHYGFSEIRPNMDEVERELRAQIELGLKKMPQTSHLSTHCGALGSSPELKALLARLSKEYKLPFALPGARGVPVPGGFDKATGVTRAALLAQGLEMLKPGLYLIVEHPGFDTPEMRAINPFFGVGREDVTRMFTAPSVLSAVKRRGILLTSYREQYKQQD